MSEKSISAQLRLLAKNLREDRLLDSEAPLLERAALLLEGSGTPSGVDETLRADTAKLLNQLVDVATRHLRTPHTQTTDWTHLRKEIGAVLGRLVAAEAVTP